MPLLATSIPPVPSSVAIPVAVVASAIPVGGFFAAAAGARVAGLRDPLRLGLIAFAVVAAWGAVVAGFAEIEFLWGHTGGRAGLWLPLSWAIPIVVSVFALRRAPRMRAALASRGGSSQLALTQIGRALGVVFLVLLAQDKLPALFAIPAAWGDLILAVSAPVAGWAYWSRWDQIQSPGTGWRRFIVGWNIVGFLDHAMAVFLGTMHFPGMLQVFEGDATTAVFARLPMSLFPTFMVSFCSAVHLFLLDALRSPSASAPRSAVPRNHDGPQL